MRIPAFDGLRGVLALAVVISHVSALTYVPWVVPARPDLFGYLTWHLGAPAVDVFFVLSGYVVALSCARYPGIWAFYAARVRRLYPLALLGALLGLLVARPVAALIPEHVAPGGLLPFLREGLHGIDVTGALTLGLGGWYDANRINPPLWTMAVETYASVLMPLMVVSARRLGWRALIPWLLGSALLTPLFWPLLLMPAFLLGALLALRPVTLPRPALIPVLVVGTVTLLIRHVLGSDDVLLRWPAALGAGLVLLAVRDLNPAGLRSCAAQWLGERSFALYVTHFPVMVVFVWLLGPALGVRASALLAVPACLLVAHAVHAVNVPFFRRAARRVSPGVS